MARAWVHFDVRYEKEVPEGHILAVRRCGPGAELVPGGWSMLTRLSRRPGAMDTRWVSDQPVVLRIEDRYEFVVISSDWGTVVERESSTLRQLPASAAHEMGGFIVEATYGVADSEVALSASAKMAGRGRPADELPTKFPAPPRKADVARRVFSASNDLEDPESDVDYAEDEEVDELGSEPLQEDTYGMTICSLVRDFWILAKGKGNFTLRMFRFMLTFGLLVTTIGIQIFLMIQVKLFVTSKAVHDIRIYYDKYEEHMYGSNESHFVLTVNGKHRGLPEFFDPALFETMDDSIKSQACRIPLSQPHFLGVVLFIWTLTCIGELKTCIDLFRSLILNTATVPSMEYVLVDSSDHYEDKSGEKVIDGLTACVKAIIVVVIILPRVAITSVLLWFGCRWFLATNDFTDLILNAVALEFILLLKDTLYLILVPRRNRRDLARTEIHPPSKKEPASYSAFLGAFSWGAVAALWVCVYMYWLQQVLPDYRWDVRAVCASWIKKRFAV